MKLVKYAQILVLSSVLGSIGLTAGLCAPLQANTTARLAQAAPQGAEDSGAPGVQLFSVTPPAAQTHSVNPARPAAKVRIALLLPLRSDTLGQAAEVLRSGFMAAYERDKGSAEVVVIPTGDATQEILSAYTAAQPDFDVIVGPLSRPAVAAIAQSGAVNTPTIALNQPEGASDVLLAMTLPPRMLAIGLSVEDEARQLAQWASTDSNGRALIMSTNAPWQRRSAKAFVAQWQRMGLDSLTMELTTVPSGMLSAASLTQLKKYIGSENPALLFAALSADQARQVRLVIGSEPQLYGTSQLNPLALPDWIGAEPWPEMNGVRLIDLPWQLQPDHPAVMAYPRLMVAAGQKRSPDMERLYALGIDAYRIAAELALHHSQFEIDGVTGKLSIVQGNGPARFERLELPATYRNGLVAPWSGMR